MAERLRDVVHPRLSSLSAHLDVCKGQRRRRLAWRSATASTAILHGDSVPRAGLQMNDDHSLARNVLHVCKLWHVVHRWITSSFNGLGLVSRMTCRKDPGNVRDQPVSHPLHSARWAQGSIHEGRIVKRPLKYVNAWALPA